ncbi:hypothetical protein GW17_00057029, partial [Ensete ventricosum]
PCTDRQQSSFPVPGLCVLTPSPPVSSPVIASLSLLIDTTDTSPDDAKIPRTPSLPLLSTLLLKRRSLCRDPPSFFGNHLRPASQICQIYLPSSAATSSSCGEEKPVPRHRCFPTLNGAATDSSHHRQVATVNLSIPPSPGRYRDKRWLLCPCSGYKPMLLGVWYMRSSRSLTRSSTFVTSSLATASSLPSVANPQQPPTFSSFRRRAPDAHF